MALNELLEKYSVADLLELGLDEQAAQKRQLETDGKLVCLLVAMGEPTSLIAGKLGVDIPFIDKIVRSTKGMEQILRMQTSLCPDPLVRVKKMANSALDVKFKLMHTAESEAVRNAAASDILDRSGGKAVAIVENRHTVEVSDLVNIDKAMQAQMEKLRKLDEIEARLKNVTPEAIAV